MDDLNEQELAFSRRLSQAPLDEQGRLEHREALRAQALAAFDAAARPAVVQSKWKRSFNHWREIMRRPLPRFMAAATACLAVVGVWLLIPGQQPAAQAFNMFAEAIVDAKSAKFQMEVRIEGQEGKQETQSYYLSPSKIRNEMQGKLKGMVVIADMKAGKFVSFAVDQKVATVMNLQNMPKAPGKPQLNDIFEQMRDLLAKNRDAKEDGFESLGEKEIDGHRAVGFRLASPLQLMTLWGDPATGLPVLVETAWSGIPRTEVTMTRFELNPKLDPALFDTTPPADYRVQSFDVDASKPTEATLIEGLRLAANLNDGQFMNNLDTASMQALIIKQALQKKADAKADSKDLAPEFMTAAMKVGRGMLFVLEMPEKADVHYAGKGVKLGEPDRAILWYKPEGTEKYRIVYADLTVNDADRAPEVAGAVRLEKTKGPDKQEKK